MERVGQGGMGIVYLAEDTRLKRKVAIKFLPQAVAVDSEARERFRVEAQAAAALNHPNISHIYAIEETNGEIFIVMEYIDGKELRQILKENPAAPLPMEDVFRYTVQIARGLQAAHKAGIIHRDIKSSNIMVTRDLQAKIMDFGLAKLQGQVQLTKEGTTLGTAAYMSPEQSRNEDADHRSDIWSLGVVLYEMVTGRLPFSGDYEAAILYAIIHDQPETASKLNPDIPPELNEILEKCLEKDRNNRYQTITEFIHDLQPVVSESGHSIFPGENAIRDTSVITKIVPPKRGDKLSGKNFKIPLLVVLSLFIVLVAAWTVSYFSGQDNPPLPSGKRMLVVLPFQNLGSVEQEYFADGITGEITSRLSGLSGLGVIARSSAMHYKNSNKTLVEIGEELGVQYVLEGTIRWEIRGDGSRRVRVNPELIKVRDATQIWSQPYEADFSSAFDLQSDIASQVARALDVNLLQAENRSLTEKLTQNSEAYDYYLRGMQFVNAGYDEQNFRIAEQMFRRAIELDPDFAAALAQLANVNVGMYWFHYDRNLTRVNQAREYLERALALAPQISEVRSAHGWYYYQGLLDYENALKEFDHSLQLKPNNADAYSGIGAVLRRQGNALAAIQSFLKAAEIDPKSAGSMDQVAETYLLLRNYSEAMKYIEKAIALHPDLSYTYNIKANIYLGMNGNTEKARQTLLEALDKRIGVQNPQFLFNLARIEMFEGHYQKALDYIQSLKVFDDQFYYLPQDLILAQIYGLVRNEELKRQHFESARKILEEKITENPSEPRYYSALGLVLAGLGSKEEAIKMGRKGVEMMPISREAWRGSARVYDLARIYSLVGNEDAALYQIDLLLSMPSDLTPVYLKIDPVWDYLRKNPRFAGIIEKHSKDGI